MYVDSKTNDIWVMTKHGWVELMTPEQDLTRRLKLARHNIDRAERRLKTVLSPDKRAMWLRRLEKAKVTFIRQKLLGAQAPDNNGTETGTDVSGQIGSGAGLVAGVNLAPGPTGFHGGPP